MWERYQQQLKEWEVAVTKRNNNFSNGCLNKVATLEKPAMFAFCLKPRGLESQSQNKGFKHRSQKRISVSGHTNSIPDHDGFHTIGKYLVSELISLVIITPQKLIMNFLLTFNCFNSGRRPYGFAYGDERFVYPGHGYDYLDDSPLSRTSPRVFSPRDNGNMRYYSMSNDGYYRNHISKLQRSKSKKVGSFMYHNDPQMMASYSQRMSASEKRNGVRWNMVNNDLPGHREYPLDGSQKHGIEQLDGSDHDEFRLRDASNAAKHARHMAKLKRERAQRLLYRADIAIHKAVSALMTAEAMKASEDSVGDSSTTNI